MKTASTTTSTPLPEQHKERASFRDGLMHGFSRYYQEYATELPTSEDVYAMVRATSTDTLPGPWKAGRVIGWYQAMQQAGDVDMLPRLLRHALACYAVRVTFVYRKGGIYA